MNTITVVTVVGTRPEIIKLSRVISALDKHVKHVLVHTGQNYDFELNEIFFQELGIRKPDHFLGAAGLTAAETIANVIMKSDKLFREINPDAVLLYGDTNSCLSVISAKRLKIPVFHMEAGNRCFDQRVPEELNRKVVDHLSDINLTLTEHARRYLVAEGIRAETVIKTGSSMKEVLSFHASQFSASDILVVLGLAPKRFFVVSCHREENIDSPRNFSDFLDSLQKLHARFGFPVIVSTHPRTRKRLESMGISELSGDIRLLKPLWFINYIKLQMEAYCVISDSGTITEEAAILGFPAVTIRQAHERPEGMDSGTLIMCGLEAEAVISAIEVVAHQPPAPIVPDYDVDNLSDKIVRIILSYTPYINRTVWRKSI